MDLNKVIKDLQKGNNIENNLSLYAGALAGSYANQGLYMLAMDLTSNYDLIRQDESCDCEYVNVLLNQIMEVIQKVILLEDGDNISDYIENVQNIRNEIIHKLDVFGDYTYFMQVYEYIINRVDYQFQESKNNKDSETFADELLAAITADENVQTMNEKIQTVLGELPIRLTTSKFFDLLKAGCHCYKGVRNDMADAFFDSIKKCARPLSLENLDKSYDNLYEVCELLANTDMADIDQETCSAVMANLIASGDFLAGIITTYIYLADISNDLLILLLSRPYVQKLTNDMQKSVTVIKELINAEQKGNFLTADEDIIGLLRELTDRQDVYQGEHMMMEDALYGILNERYDMIEKTNQTEAYEQLHLCMQIATTAVLSQPKAYTQYFSVDVDDINKVVCDLENHFKEVFGNVNRMQKRSMMALTIGSLPVVFNSIEEVRSYVVQSLDNCRDQAEKTASMDLLSQMFLNPSFEVNE